LNVEGSVVTARCRGLLGDLEVDSLTCRYGESKVIADTSRNADREVGNRDCAVQANVVIESSDAPGVS